jgi:hypothetical protein
VTFWSDLLEGPSENNGWLLACYRVRVGAFTGVRDPADVQHDRTTGRTRYSGTSIAMAKVGQFPSPLTGPGSVQQFTLKHLPKDTFVGAAHPPPLHVTRLLRI